MLATWLIGSVPSGQCATQSGHPFSSCSNGRGAASRWSYMPAGVDVSGEDIIREGAMVQVLFNTYERDRLAREKCIQKYGRNCYVCGFSFRAVYGKFADGIIHVHHLRPLAQIRKEYVVDPIAHLRPVCPNCHSVLHWRTPAYSIEELRCFLRRSISNAKGRHEQHGLRPLSRNLDN